MRTALILTAIATLIAGLLLLDSVHALVYGDWDDLPDAGDVK